MICYNDIIEVQIEGKNFIKVKLAKFLFNLQCSTFESSINKNIGKKIFFKIIVCKINSLEIFKNKNKEISINLKIDSPYKVVLSYVLQIWSIINNYLIIHGGIYKKNSLNFILTGKGGVGKTFKIITACLNKEQSFMGDDLVLLNGNKAIPMIRPICLYPEHIKINKLKPFIKGKIIKRNIIFLKIKRKLLCYLSALIPKFDFLYFKSYQNEFSKLTWAYVPPKKIGMKVNFDPVKLSGFITLVRKNEEVKESNFAKDIIQSTEYEFNIFNKELDYLTHNFQNKSFNKYISEKIKEVNIE